MRASVLSTHETLESRLAVKGGPHFASSYFPGGWGRLMPKGVTIMHNHQRGWPLEKRMGRRTWVTWARNWCCRPGGGGRNEAYVCTVRAHQGFFSQFLSGVCRPLAWDQPPQNQAGWLAWAAPGLAWPAEPGGSAESERGPGLLLENRERVKKERERIGGREGQKTGT